VSTREMGGQAPGSMPGQHAAKRTCAALHSRAAGVFGHSGGRPTSPSRRGTAMPSPSANTQGRPPCPAGRGLAGALWGARPGCTARVPPPCPRGLASVVRGGCHRQTISRTSSTSYPWRSWPPVSKPLQRSRRDTDGTSRPACMLGQSGCGPPRACEQRPLAGAAPVCAGARGSVRRLWPRSSPIPGPWLLSSRRDV
jgi:hypothetical protein